MPMTLLAVSSYHGNGKGFLLGLFSNGTKATKEILEGLLIPSSCGVGLQYLNFFLKKIFYFM